MTNLMEYWIIQSRIIWIKVYKTEQIKYQKDQVLSAQDISWQEAGQDNDSYYYYHTKKNNEKLEKVQRKHLNLSLRLQSAMLAAFVVT